MSSLKELRTRISSVRSTRKITQAMKMVAASKLRRAQERAERARPYAAGMEAMVARLADTVAPGGCPAPAGRDRQPEGIPAAGHHRGSRALRRLQYGCGPGGAAQARGTRRGFGRGEDLLRRAQGLRHAARTHGGRIVGSRLLPPGRDLPFAEAAAVAEEILGLFADGGFDLCTMHYNRFRSAMSQWSRNPESFRARRPESEAPEAPTAAPGRRRNARIRTRRGRTPCRTPAAQPRRADPWRVTRERGRRTRRPHDGDGECHPERGAT